MKKKTFNLGSTCSCPDCGGTMIQTELADQCNNCGYYFYYGK